MGEVVYRSEVAVDKEGGPLRYATISGSIDVSTSVEVKDA